MFAALSARTPAAGLPACGDLRRASRPLAARGRMELGRVRQVLAAPGDQHGVAFWAPSSLAGAVACSSSSVEGRSIDRREGGSASVRRARHRSSTGAVPLPRSCRRDGDIDHEAPSRPVIDWDVAGLPEAPSAPETLKQTGLTLGFLNDMILRTLYMRGGMLGLDLARLLCLPFKVIEEALELPQGREVRRGDRRRPDRPRQLRFNLTELGRRRAQEAMKQCAYVGPAPVPLEDYVEQTYRQAVTGITVTPEALRAAFAHLVIKDELFNAIGPAIVSGKSVFIYGPPGNGKTSMARAIGDFMNSQRRRDLRPLRLPGREQHHHRLRPVAAPAVDDDDRRPPGGQRGHHPPAAQHRHRRSRAGCSIRGRSSSPAAS